MAKRRPSGDGMMAIGHKWNDHENELNYKYMEPSM